MVQRGTVAEKRMKDNKSIKEIEEEFLAYGKMQDWHSLDTSATYLSIRYMADERYEDALEAVVSFMAIQLSGCSENDRVCKYDKVNVCTYHIGLIKECCEKLFLSQNKLEKKVVELLTGVFEILPFSYYESETALEILKDCRNKPFNPKKYDYDHARPKEGRLAAANEVKAGARVEMQPYPCF